MSAVDVQLPPKFDPLDPGFLDDPYPVYERLRDAGPLVRGGPAQWIVARHAEVSALLREPRLSHDFPDLYQQLALGGGAAFAFIKRTVLNREGSSHAVLRRMLRRALGSTPADVLRRRIGELADGLLTPALEAGRLDWAADLALPLPVAVACDLTGVPAGDRPRVQALATELAKAFTVVLPEPERPSVDRAAVELHEYVAGLLAGPATPPQLEALAAAARDGDTPVDLDDVVDNVIFLFLAGFTTTVHLVATGGAALLLHPDQLRRLRGDRSLVPCAVEEFLRYDAPIQIAARFVTEAFAFGGRTLRPGRVVHLLLGAANHDERCFAEPGRLDVGRAPNPHVSFGGGVHLCLGASLGRLEAAVVVERLLDRCAVFDQAGPFVRRPVQVFRSYSSIPAVVRAS